MQNTTQSDHVHVSDLVRHPQNGTTDLYLVRHGQTIANVQRQLVGATDIPLNELGERQASLVASRFTGISIDALVTSPLSRARRTAEQIGQITGQLPVVVPGLSEIDFGRVEGLTIHQVIDQFPELRDQLGDFQNLELAWPGGESRRGFATRTMAAFLGIMNRYQNQTVAAVCHGGVIGAFCAELGVGPQDDAVRWTVANCSVTHVVVTPENTRLEMWNDISHLDEPITDVAEDNFLLISPESKESL